MTGHIFQTISLPAFFLDCERNSKAVLCSQHVFWRQPGKCLFYSPDPHLSPEWLERARSGRSRGWQTLATSGSTTRSRNEELLGLWVVFLPLSSHPFLRNAVACGKLTLPNEPLTAVSPTAIVIILQASCKFSDDFCPELGLITHWRWREIPELFGWDPLPSLGRIWPGRLPGKAFCNGGEETRGSVCKVLRLCLKPALPESKNLRHSQRLGGMTPSLAKGKKGT